MREAQHSPAAMHTSIGGGRSGGLQAPATCLAKPARRKLWRLRHGLQHATIAEAARHTVGAKPARAPKGKVTGPQTGSNLLGPGLLVSTPGCLREGGSKPAFSDSDLPLHWAAVDGARRMIWLAFKALLGPF